MQQLAYHRHVIVSHLCSRLCVVVRINITLRALNNWETVKLYVTNEREPNKLVEQNHHCNDFELRDNQFVKIIAAVISFSGLIWVYFKTDIIVVCTQPCNVYPQYTTIQCVTNSQVDRD